jgi:tetratricopeptide (TPR) repeat protein
MATKRKVVKKNIKRDPLVTYALKVSNYAQEHFNQVIIGVAVLIAVIAVVVFTANSRQNAARQADRQLAQALALYQQQDYESAKGVFSQVYNNYGGRGGAIARYYKAECEMAQSNYAQALMDYEAYLDRAGDFDEFRAAAMYGSAVCHEGLENYELAATTMVQVLETVDEDDPRYMDSAYKAGELFAKAGNNERALHYFQTVAEKGSGRLKDRADAAVAMLGGP